jgi:hypothetical protein
MCAVVVGEAQEAVLSAAMLQAGRRRRAATIAPTSGWPSKRCSPKGRLTGPCRDSCAAKEGNAECGRAR